MAGKCENVVMVRHDNNSNLKLIPVECGAKGLGIKLSKSSWDPYPFISKIDDESSAMRQGVQIGDCLLQVNGHDVLGLRIQEIAEQIHGKSTSDDNINEIQINLLLWRSSSLQQGYQPQLLHNLVSDLFNVFQLMECPVCMEIPTAYSRTYQCVNGHIVCEKCRLKPLEKCPVCRVKLGNGRCLIADKILRYLHNNSAIKIGPVWETSKTMSSEIDERQGQRTSTNKSAEHEPENLHTKRHSCLPFSMKLKSLTFWKDS